MGHVHGTGKGKYLTLSIILTFTFVAFEVAAGIYSNSLSLLSDAGHNFADAFALVLAKIAIWIARRPADSQRTFGYHRATILAAWINAGSLIVIALFIFWEAVERFGATEQIRTGWMMGVAAGAVAINVLITMLLSSEAKDDLNIRSAYMHMLGDALSAAGVIVAGFLIMITGWVVIDPIVSIIIAVFILWSSWDIFKESIDILLESAPRDLNMSKLVHALDSTEGVEGVHDLHVWTISSGMKACSMHLLVKDQPVSEVQSLQKQISQMLEHEFRISHATIQIETESCDEAALHCELKALETDDHGHGHSHGHSHSHDKSDDHDHAGHSHGDEDHEHAGHSHNE